MLKVNLHLATGQMFSLSRSINAGSAYRQSDMEANVSHPDLAKLTEMERTLREAREKSNERIDQDTLAELNKPKPAPKKPGAEEESPDEEAPDEGGEAEDGEPTPAGNEEEGDEEFE